MMYGKKTTKKMAGKPMKAAGKGAAKPGMKPPFKKMGKKK